MPRLTAEQVAQLRELAGLPAGDTSDIGVIYAAAVERLRARRVDPARRDRVVLAAVRDGKFPVSRVPFWLQAYEADPAGTEATIAGLTAVPTTDAAVAHAGDDLAALETALYGESEQVRHVRQDAEADRVDAELAAAESQAAAGLTDAEYETLFGPDK